VKQKRQNINEPLLPKNKKAKIEKQRPVMKKANKRKRIY
jgi:hypothetical protein